MKKIILLLIFSIVALVTRSQDVYVFNTSEEIEEFKDFFGEQYNPILSRNVNQISSRNPCSYVVLNTQTQVDDFGLCNCSVVEGLLLVLQNNPSDPITDLSPISSVTEVQGGLYIANTSLTSLYGIHNIKKSKYFTIYNNDLLVSLDGLGLRELGGVSGSNFFLQGNEILSDISASGNINPNTATTWWVRHCPELAICTNAFSCRYLSGCDSVFYLIEYNLPGCNTKQEIIDDCNSKDCVGTYTNIGDPCDDHDPSTIDDRIDDWCNCKGECDDDFTVQEESVQAFPNPAKNIINIEVSDLSPGLYFITTPDGKVVKFIKQ